jgi:hypothetical protein
VDESLFGESTKPEALKQANSIAAQTRGIGGSAQCRLRMSALERAARQASSARSAGLRQRTYDMISDPDLCDVRTHCGHDPRNLMAKYRRRWSNIVSSEKQIGVAQPGCFHLDKDFAPDWHGNLNVLEIEPATERIEHKSLHLRPPYGCGSSCFAVIDVQERIDAAAECIQQYECLP